ncbi:hypothetical protein FPANT_4856 [Fusarium pseudoanthophilum]|uniref:Uncharacterized protein n=1 Tax=Fusarium pseudoanthophilum TaxID=48495 RepID=A0A8H5PD27_9HYPO|nr:hypothetical protein FPANT_4856 [Fusarium pseudoanthophilum]
MQRPPTSAIRASTIFIIRWMMRKSRKNSNWVSAIPIRPTGLAGIVEIAGYIISLTLSECGGFVALTRHQDHPGADITSES